MSLRTSSYRPASGEAHRAIAVTTVAVAAVTFVVYSWWPDLLSALGLRLSSDVLEDVPVLVDSLVAFTAAAVIALATRGLGVTHVRTWLPIAAGAAAWGVGSAIWLAYFAAGSEPPYPGPQDVAFVAMPVLVTVALVRYPVDRRLRRGPVGVVDAMLAAAATLLILWVAALRWAPQSGGADLWASTVNLVYPLADVVILMLIADLIRRLRVDLRLPFLFLGAGILAIWCSDILYLVLEAYGTYESTPLATDAGWSTGWVLVTGAAILAGRGPRALSESDASAQELAGPEVPPAVPDDEAEALTSRPFPLALALLALVLVMVVISIRPADVPWTAPLTVVVIGLLLVRQTMTLHQNRQLTEMLAGSLDALAHAAVHDGLTGLHNRVGLDERIADAMEAARSSGTTPAVAFVDLDHLKAVNDSLGHAAGDQLIMTTARNLTASGVGDVTRFGGDEFVVVLDGVRIDALGGAIGSLLQAGSRTVHLDEGDIRPSVSVGVAIAGPGLSAPELLRRADVALYRAKQSGRRRAAVYEPSMDAATRKYLELEPELRAAVDDDEFVLHYQPVVDAATGRLYGAEALLRWQHPSRGLLAPAAFLDHADALGLLPEIGKRTLDIAARDFAAVTSVAGAEHLKVAVNLSASELADGRAGERVRRSLADAGLGPASLVLEIREDVVVDETTHRTIAELAASGVEIAVDDFGTGNSSLRQLGSYPASVLKIDRSFVDGLGTEPEDTFVVRAVLNLAHNLGLRTVAEGVETETQLRLLRDLDCDLAQGWLLGRPVPLDEFVDRYVRPAVTARTSG